MSTSKLKLLVLAGAVTLCIAGIASNWTGQTPSTSLRGSADLPHLGAAEAHGQPKSAEGGVQRTNPPRALVPPPTDTAAVSDSSGTEDPKPEVPMDGTEVLTLLLECKEPHVELTTLTSLLRTLLDREDVTRCAVAFVVRRMTPQHVADLADGELARVMALLEPDLSPFYSSVESLPATGVAGHLRRALIAGWQPTQDVRKQVMSQILDAHPGEPGVQMTLDYAEGGGLTVAVVEALSKRLDARGVPLLCDRILDSQTPDGIRAASQVIQRVHDSSMTPVDREEIVNAVEQLAATASPEFWRTPIDSEREAIPWRRLRTALMLKSTVAPSLQILDDIDPLMQHEDWMVRAQVTWILANLGARLDPEGRSVCIDRLRASSLDVDPNVCRESLAQLVQLDPESRTFLEQLAASHPIPGIRQEAERLLGSTTTPR